VVGEAGQDSHIVPIRTSAWTTQPLGRRALPSPEENIAKRREFSRVWTAILGKAQADLTFLFLFLDEKTLEPPHRDWLP